MRSPSRPGRWNWTTRAKYTVSNTTTHGTARFRASDLVEQSLNGRTPTAYDEDPEGNRTVNQPETIAAREKQQQLKDRFGEWVWEDPSRAKRLADDYNFRFNNIRLRDFDGSHLTLPGMVRTSLRDGDLAPHQKNAVWRILQGGSPLLAHVVGAGKTWTMTAAAMELRRLDLAKKPMFVVPESPGRPMGSGVSEALPAGPVIHRRKGTLRDRKPSAGDGANRDWKLRCGHRLASFVRVPSGIRRIFQSFRPKAGGGTGCGDRAGEGIERRQPPHREGAGKSEEAAHGPAEETSRQGVERPHTYL